MYLDAQSMLGASFRTLASGMSSIGASLQPASPPGDVLSVAGLPSLMAGLQQLGLLLPANQCTDPACAVLVLPRSGASGSALPLVLRPSLS